MNGKSIKCIFPFFIFIIGLLMFLYPMLFWNKMPGDLGDGRFINYVLEHGWLWLNRVDIHSSFWTMPFFYPNQNTLAYSDIMFGGMILYVPVRFFVDSPQIALQIWFVLCVILNYISAYLLLRKGLKFDFAPSSIGAFLFAFGLPRQNQINHLQLLTQFYMIFSIFSFLKLDMQKSKLHNHICFLCGVIFFVLQIYTSFYFGWFMVFGLILFMIILFCSPSLKSKLFDFFKYYKNELIIYFFLTIIFLYPLISHYIAVGAQLNWISGFLFNFTGLVSSNSLLDNYVFPKNNLLSIPENRVGIGLLTSVFILIGLLKNSKYNKHIILFIVLILCIFGIKLLNFALYIIVPGASAIRACGRMIFLLMPIYIYGIANFLKNINNKKVFCIAVFIIILEQLAFPNQYNWTKAENENRIKAYNIPKSCKIIYYDIKVSPEWIYQNDLLWVSSINNIYLINGYSGYMPNTDKTFAQPECRFEIKESF